MIIGQVVMLIYQFNMPYSLLSLSSEIICTRENGLSRGLSFAIKSRCTLEIILFVRYTQLYDTNDSKLKSKKKKFSNNCRLINDYIHFPYLPSLCAQKYVKYLLINSCYKSDIINAYIYARKKKFARKTISLPALAILKYQNQIMSNKKTHCDLDTHIEMLFFFFSEKAH